MVKEIEISNRDFKSRITVTIYEERALYIKSNDDNHLFLFKNEAIQLAYTLLMLSTDIDI
jgi:hypothetical protein